MTTRSWILKRFARTPRTVRNNLARYRPRLEALEGRLAPAGASPQLTAGSLRRETIPVDSLSIIRTRFTPKWSTPR
jgi:hypothetical protein